MIILICMEVNINTNYCLNRKAFRKIQKIPFIKVYDSLFIMLFNMQCT